MAGWERGRLVSTVDHSNIRGLVATCHVSVAELPQSRDAGQLAESAVPQCLGKQHFVSLTPRRPTASGVLVTVTAKPAAAQ